MFHDDTIHELRQQIFALEAELAAARAVVEATRASLEGNHDWLETYCDVGSPDDCDHCVIVGAIAAYDAIPKG